MNTNDFKPLTYDPKTCWELMFEKQKEVFIEFMKQEKIDWTTYDFDINCYEDQQLLKDFLEIRFVEELTEATEDLIHPDHFLEEMVDAFNFLMEAYIIYGWDYRNLTNWPEYFRDSSNKDDFKNLLNFLTSDFLPITKKEFYAQFYLVVEATGKTCNKLKNRPWKQCQYLVDLIVFEERFRNIFKQFISLCVYCGITQRILFDCWSQKYKVNKYRLETRY